MKYIAIEKARYELHQEYLKEPCIQTYKQNFTTRAFWKEIGAFTVVAPPSATVNYPLNLFCNSTNSLQQVQ